MHATECLTRRRHITSSAPPARHSAASALMGDASFASGCAAPESPASFAGSGSARTSVTSFGDIEGHEDGGPFVARRLRGGWTIDRRLDIEQKVRYPIPEPQVVNHIACSTMTNYQSNPRPNSTVSLFDAAAVSVFAFTAWDTNRGPEKEVG